jgi:ATP-dependent 26S proteasome regulatory subunit
MDKKKVLVKVHPEGKFVVDIDKNIDIGDVTPNCRVALRNDSYTLHKILPNKVDPLVRKISNQLNQINVLRHYFYLPKVIYRSKMTWSSRQANSIH